MNPANRQRREDSLPGLPLVILADDLTGACDAAVAFTRRADSVRVGVGDSLVTGSQVWGISTQSRDADAREAEDRLRDLARRLPADAEVFKKVDSVFRGNTYVEIGAALRYVPYDVAVLAPAYPAHKRRMKGGMLQVCEVRGECMIPVAEVLADHGCHPHRINAGLSVDEIGREMQASLSSSTRSVLCDAWEQTDLSRTVRAARSLGVRVLWIGSGGLAQALADDSVPLRVTEADLKRKGDVLFFVGSDHAVTRAQAARLRKETCVAECGCETSLPLQTSLLLNVVRGGTTADDIRRSLAKVLPANVGCLFMTGGDTAWMVCRALGIESLRLVREFAPGVPVGAADGGAFNGIPVVLKSGGFGDEDVMCRVLQEFGNEEQVKVR